MELLHPSKPLILGAHVTSTWRQSSTPLLSLWTRASRLAPTPKSLKSWELDLTGENQSNQFSTETPLQGPYKFTNAYKCRLITFLTSTFLDVTVGFQNLFTMLFCPSVIWQACKLRDTASGRLNWLLNGIFLMNNLLVCQIFVNHPHLWLSLPICKLFTHGPVQAGKKNSKLELYKIKC